MRLPLPAPALFAALLGAALAGSGLAGRADLALYDLGQSLWPRTPRADVVIVAVDEASLARIGRWPWRRAVHATLVQRLHAAGARAVGLDLLFHEADSSDPAGDAALAQALAQYGRAVLPVYVAQHPDGALQAQLPLAALQDAARLGHIHFELDADGIGRSLYLHEGPPGAPPWPQFALALLQAAGLDASLPAGTRSRPAPAPTAPPTAAAWQRDHWLRLPFLGPPGHITSLSYVDVLSGAVSAAELRDRIVLVGATAAGLGDRYPTPVSGQERLMPGVEINATALHALLAGRGVQGPSTAVLALLSALLALLPWLSLRRRGVQHLAAHSAAWGAALLLGALLALRALDWWLPPAAALLALAGGLAASYTARLRAAQRALDAELHDLSQVPSLLPLPPDTTADNDPLLARASTVREATRRLIALEEFLSSLVSALPVGAVVEDAQGRRLMANPQAQRLLENNAFDHVALEASAQQGPAFETQAGSRELFVQTTPLPGTAQRPAARLLCLTDITPLKQAQRQRELMLRFLGHDLRAPLSTLLAVCELHRESDPGLTGQVRRLAGQALALAEDFLHLARLHNAPPPALEPVHLADVLQDAREDVWARAQARGIQLALHLDTATAAPQALGVASELRRALVNLLENALRHAPDGSSIGLHLESAAPEGWRLCVATPATAATAGAGEAAPDGARFGLGLLFVGAVAERHGGRLDSKLHADGGMRHCLWLPAAAPAAD